MAVVIGGSTLIGRVDLITVAFHLSLAHALVNSVLAVETLGVMFSVFPTFGIINCFSCVLLSARKPGAVSYVIFGSMLLLTTLCSTGASAGGNRLTLPCLVCQLVALAAMSPFRESRYSPGKG